MSYQNVGTPRFYVDVYSYFRAIGLTRDEPSPFNFGLNPTNQVEYDFSHATENDGSFFTFKVLEGTHIDLVRNPIHNKTVYGFFGHNFNSVEVRPRVKINIPNVEDSYGDGIEIVNWLATDIPTYNGFSMYETEHALSGDKFDMFTFRLRSRGANSGTVKLGSLFMGTYFDMPNSPDLSLKLSFEYDGVKTIQTRGGATLSNATYIKPADWGDGGAWQLGSDEDGNPVDNLRSGRRVWDLSFSYISDSDLMPKVAATTNLGSGDNQYINPYTNTAYENSLLQGTDFFSQVWNRTLGGHLPFIFQANSSNNSPDQFSICRFDMDALEYDQVAHNVYNVKLKIREVW